MNDLDVFNQIKDHLLKQAERCSDKTGDCAYRGLRESDYEEMENAISSEILKTFSDVEKYEDYEMTDDFYDDLLYRMSEKIAHLPDDDPRLMKCAVGHIIKNSYYNPRFEGSNVDDHDVWLAVQKSNPQWKANNISRTMLFFLQRIHDGIEPSEWGYKFSKFADYFDEKGQFDIIKLIKEHSNSEELFGKIHSNLRDKTDEQRYDFMNEEESIFYDCGFHAVSGVLFQRLCLDY